MGYKKRKPSNDDNDSRHECGEKKGQDSRRSPENENSSSDMDDNRGLVSEVKSLVGVVQHLESNIGGQIVDIQRRVNDLGQDVNQVE